MSKQQIVKALIQGIRHDLQAYQQLGQLLLRQQASYLQFNGTTLTELVKKQEHLLAQLQRSASQRRQLLQQLGLSADKQGMTTLMKKLPSPLNTQVRQSWQQLENHIQSCQKTNQVNGNLSASYGELLMQIKGEPAYGTALMQS
ncbi:flagellar export chaperone FlgN [Photobacterium halotolerans]|uniref:flagellar export chaperone FlgN n=1 Tax=Photobacterium halotolerans TaxID=265726 RepID=UPI000419DD67|nr:flagellar export chaperone FlgN [Photobacterium halotolerans]NAX49238.1 flagellar protein FlgN [Photobacterium halotolerans]